ncbi:VRR-NUC domain-containing protein [Modicisalibacter coralii]|uniref:VRR-NUC domain-containing protein n=1 Tax=Modicisalibacter coralii TaxID=2304602 RepID=UPI00100C3203|nr:VRR-NUC domain-containing protein [Halomonas coralii]
MSWRTHGQPGPKPVRRKRSLNADGKPRRKSVNWEGQEQAALMLWLRGEAHRGTPVAPAFANTYAVPNGGTRHSKEAANLKAQGVKSGVSDLVIAVPRGGYHGLYLELKATPPHGASLAQSQREWLARMEAAGYCAALARGIDEARAVITEYMSRPATEVVAGPDPLIAGSAWR